MSQIGNRTPLRVKVEIITKETPSPTLVDEILQSFLHLKSKRFDVFSAGQIRKNDTNSGVHFFVDAYYKPMKNRKLEGNKIINHPPRQS